MQIISPILALAALLLAYDLMYQLDKEHPMSLRGPDPMTYALAQFERQEAENDEREEALNDEAQSQLDDFARGEITELLGEDTVEAFLNDSTKPFELMCHAWRQENWEQLGETLKAALVEFADEQLEHEISREQLHSLLCARAQENELERARERRERFQ